MPAVSINPSVVCFKIEVMPVTGSKCTWINNCVVSFLCNQFLPHKLILVAENWAGGFGVVADAFWSVQAPAGDFHDFDVRGRDVGISRRVETFGRIKESGV